MSEKIKTAVMEIIKAHMDGEDKNTKAVLSDVMESVNELETFEQEPCDDAISREAVCDYIAEYVNDEYSTQAECEMVDLMIKGIKQLPSVTQKSGKWIAVYQGDEIINYRCSECELGDTNGSTNLYGWDYCRRCGAKMESEE